MGTESQMWKMTLMCRKRISGDRKLSVSGQNEYAASQPDSDRMTGILMDFENQG
jgi:hypothetical protein